MTHSVHGTALSIGGKGVLLLGSPGAGKSSLALRLIDQPGYGLSELLLRARLVADDQVVIERIADAVWMAPPPALAGKLEIRGQGIVSCDHKPEAECRLVVDLGPHGKLERMPEDIDMFKEILGVKVPCLRLSGTDAATPARIRAALSL